MTTKLTLGCELFRAFIERHGLSQSAISRELGISRQAIIDWLDGTKRPAADARAAIAVWTVGEVSPDSWRTDEEREALGKVVPFGAGKAVKKECRA